MQFVSSISLALLPQVIEMNIFFTLNEASLSFAQLSRSDQGLGCMVTNNWCIKSSH